MMKYFILTIFILILSVAFAACSGTGEDNKTSTVTTGAVSTTAAATVTAKPEKVPESRILAAFQRAGIKDWNGKYDFDAKQKEAVEEYFKKENIAVEFRKDGVYMTGRYGNTVAGGEWPVTGIIAKIPKADFGGVINSSEFEKSAVVSLKGVTKKNYSDYAGKLKGAGFSKNAKEVDANGNITFTAENKGGAKVQFSFTEKSGIAIVTVTLK